MLPENLRAAFKNEVGSIYGQTSGYVHLTPSQIQERIAAVDAGRTAGWETGEDVNRLNGLISRGLAASLVLIYHSVPSWVAGDWFGESNGASVQWYFRHSAFVSAIDAFFDYKAERQDRLSEIISARQSAIAF